MTFAAGACAKKLFVLVLVVKKNLFATIAVSFKSSYYLQLFERSSKASGSFIVAIVAPFLKCLIEKKEGVGWFEYPLRKGLKDKFL